MTGIYASPIQMNKTTAIALTFALSTLERWSSDFNKLGCNGQKHKAAKANENNIELIFYQANCTWENHWIESKGEKRAEPNHEFNEIK